MKAEKLLLTNVTGRYYKQENHRRTRRCGPIFPRDDTNEIETPQNTEASQRQDGRVIIMYLYQLFAIYFIF